MTGLAKTSISFSCILDAYLIDAYGERMFMSRYASNLTRGATLVDSVDNPEDNRAKGFVQIIFEK